MKQLFSESYSRVGLGISPEQLERRWQGIEQYIEKEDLDVFELVKMYYGLKNNEEFVQEFVKVFNDLDISFTKNNRRELSLLSGIILAELMENKDYQLNTIFSIVCLSKYNIDVVLPEIIEKAIGCFGSLSAKSREAAHVYKNVPTKPFTDCAKSLKENPSMDETQIQNLEAAYRSIASSITALVSNQREMGKELELYREESSILSWICGEWSNDLDIQLSKKRTQKSVAFVLAKELADLVRVLPGPYASKSFIKKMLDLCKGDKATYSLAELVDSLDNNSKQRIIDSYDCIDSAEVITPILCSVKCALETGAPDVWKPVVSGRLGFDFPSTENNILDWAELMYLECMLIKTNRE
mgnify:CR=1 FL=1